MLLFVTSDSPGPAFWSQQFGLFYPLLLDKLPALRL
jgi:hypothetical protein